MKRVVVLGANHRAGMAVPLPGSSCASCKFLVARSDGPHCSNRSYQRWARTSTLFDTRTRRRVMNPQGYCSDWYEPNAAAALELERQLEVV